MNYIGKFVTNIYEFYNDLNPATLSGAIDVVVVEQQDGSFLSSPFHVRFGKRGVFNRREKIVDITVNGEPVDLRMKLGETGEAFFVESVELEDGDSRVSPATSPLPPSFMNPFNLPSSLPTAPPPSLATTSSLVQRTAAEIKPSSTTSASERVVLSSREASESPKRERHESGNSESAVTANGSLDPLKTKSRSRRRRQRAKARKIKHDEDIFRMDLSDDEKELPQDDTQDDEISKESLVRTSSLPDVLDAPLVLDSLNNQADDLRLHRRRKSSHSFSYIPINPHVSFASTLPARPNASNDVLGTRSEGQLTPPKNVMDDNVSSGFLSDSEVDLKKTETKKVTEDEGVNVTWKWGQLPEKTSSKTPSPEGLTPTKEGSLDSLPSQGSEKVDEKENRSYLRGMLNLIRRPKPVSASKPKDVPKVKEEAEEPGKYLSDLVAEDLSQSQKEKYLALETYEAGPGTRKITNDSTSAIQPASSENVPNKGLAVPALVEVEGKSIELVPLAAQERGKVVEALTTSEPRSSSAYSSMAGSPPMAGTPPLSDTDSDKTSELGLAYKKTLRLSSEQIESLPLQPGVNEAEFCIVTKYQGSARCKCNIFLWRYDDKIVISDIDGTITKSDILGHILPVIGSTWAQAGVAGLYNRIANNGYKFMYLSSRAIGQASFTRDHLKSIIQENVALPDGPLLLSPKSLFLAFHQEVIVKKPEEFKIACLKDIKALFPRDRNPFFAAYGNKTTDLMAYSTVGVPMTRIFTINYQGQLKHEILRQAPSSYSQQSNLVDMLFPPLKAHPDKGVLVSENEFADEFSSFVYWKSPLPDIVEMSLLPAPESEPESSRRKGKKDSLKSLKVKSVSPTKELKSPTK